MLKSLTINNVVLIKKAEIDFSSGLCILSGETGSGKSILLDALGLAIGFRSNFRLIGEARNYAQITAEFDISHNKECQNFLKENDLLLEDDNNLIIRRIIKENSTSKAYVNDNAIGINLLAKIGEFLVEIHGQNDQRGLLNPACHMQILDNFAGNGTKLRNLEQIYRNFKEIDSRIIEIKQKEEFFQREKDYLEHICLELEKANITVGEEDELVTKKDHLAGKEKILKFLNELKTNFLEANSQITTGQRYLLRNQYIIDEYLKDMKDELEDLNVMSDKQIADLDDKIAEITAKISETQNSHDNLDEIEERLFLIRNLARKHNVSCDELPKFAEESQEKLQKITFDQNSIATLEQKRQQLVNDYKKSAQELNKLRQKSAIELGSKVEAELKFLKMASVKFVIDVNYDDSQELKPAGFDKIHFKASINNKNFDNIAKIASGGELSRFMLALKVAISDQDSSQTMIFDEIDTGIGGAVANAVGIRLKTLSKNRQILVVTHQPQIAAKSDMHFQISKIANDSQVNTIITNLNSQQKQKEIARMLSGENISSQALEAAKNLIENEG